MSKSVAKGKGGLTAQQEREVRLARARQARVKRAEQQTQAAEAQLAKISEAVAKSEENQRLVAQMRLRVGVLEKIPAAQLTHDQKQELTGSKIKLQKIDEILGRQKSKEVRVPAVPAAANPPRVGFFRAAWNRFASLFARRGNRVAPADPLPNASSSVSNENQDVSAVSYPANLVRPFDSNDAYSIDIANISSGRNSPDAASHISSNIAGDGDNISISPSEAELKALKADIRGGADDESMGSENEGFRSSPPPQLSQRVKQLLKQAASVEEDLIAVQQESKKMIGQQRESAKRLARGFNVAGVSAHQELEAELNALSGESSRAASPSPSNTSSGSLQNLMKVGSTHTSGTPKTN